MKKLILIFTLIFATLPLFAGAYYSFSLEYREEQETNYTVLRCWAIITCNDESWELRLPHTESDIKYFDEPQFEQTAEGFCLKYNWGGGKWTSHDTFFFTFYPYEDEPVLYKVQSNTEIYGSMENGDVGIVSQYDDEFDIEPAIKISRLGAEKMERLSGGGYNYLPKVICRDSDWEKPISDRTMHLEVYKEGELIQNLEYVYEADNHPEQKRFELADLNFDGFDDILILSGCTMNGSQPYYEAYIWDWHDEQYHFNPPCWKNICSTYIKCDEINRLLYAEYNTTRGLIYHYIYEYDKSEQEYILAGTLYYNYPTDSYSENEKYNHWSEDWDLSDPTVVEFEDLPERWKRAVDFKGFDF
ncbi:MAG: hypothetical protein IK002_02800 [Treponema sp.]|uniref:XAC2610-related protein n=1 Tax=Treponema sp. TaxID=166 RepID=UPI00298E1D87|nr:hypothetical protein [Treponema sp.]MBR5932895.1 hypothetical protein [Treponema sp.]